MVAKAKEKYFFYGFLLLIAILCLAIFEPFLTVILMAASFAVVLYPLYGWMNTHLARQRNWLASLLTVLTFVVIIGVPLFFIGARVVNQGQALFTSLSENGGAGSYIDEFSTKLTEYIPGATGLDLRSKINDSLSFFSSTAASIFSSTLHTIFSILLMLLAIFYFLKDGESWRKYLIRLSPLADKHDERILQMLDRAVNGVMKGYVLIGLVQGFLLGLGLWVFGVPNAVLWGVFAGIASMIPSIGTGFISIPAVIYLFVIGATGHAIGLLIWAVILVGTIDNLLNPFVVGKNIDLPPLLILFSVLGGIALMGAPGIIIGPLAISLFSTLTSIYQEDFKNG